MWDAFQQDVLDALGHTVYLQRAQAEVVAMPARADGAGDTRLSLPPALLQALARAAGVGVDELPPLPPLVELRTPAGKRALWPQLRRLRRGRR